MPYPFNNYNPYNGYPYNVQPMQNAQMTQQGAALVRVSGEAEAYNYPMAPGVTMMFTDGGFIYVKTTDSSPTGGFRFERFRRDEPQKPEPKDYVTREEFEAFKASVSAKEAAKNVSAE